jgi:peptidylprolyl isomerase/peptidyl-prolyl cis-trans isomerase D
MAILNSIRKRGIFLILIIALALFAFILSDILTKGGSSVTGQETAAIINGTEISRLDFMQQVDATQQNLGPNGSTAQAMNIVWQRELRRVLLEEQFNKLGLTAESAQVKDALRNSLASNPQFQNEAGMFDEAALQEYIATVKSSSPQLYQQGLEFEKNTEQQVLQNMYFNLVQAGLRTTLAEGEQQYRFENDKVNLEFVQVPYSSIPDEEVSVSDSEIEKYIRDHEDQFKVDPQVDIQYVSFTEEPSASDIEAAEQSIVALLDNRVEYNSRTQTNDTVKGLRTTTDYEALINAYSDRNYVDRWMLKNELPASVADTLIALGEGDIYGPYRIDNTFNITKITDVSQKYDSVNSKHILIRYDGSFRAPQDVGRTKEQAEQLADSLLTVIKNDKSKFEALAGEFSEDNTNKDNGGELGYFGPGAMVAPYDDFIFGNSVGTVDVVETDFGFHVVKIEDQKNLQKAIKTATITKEIQPSEKTLNDVFSQASNFEVAAMNGDFAEVAKEQDLSLKPVNKIGRLDANIPGIGDNRQVINWAFNEETEVGDLKRFTVPGGYAIVQLTRKSPEGLMSIAEASAQVTPILRKEKKAEKIRASITGSTLQEIASNQNVSVQNASAITMAAPTLPGAGREPKVVGAAFGKKAGETTGLIDGNSGVYMVKVLSVNEAPALDNYASYANQLNQQAASGINTGVFNALKNAADIEDNRADLF